MADNSGNGAMQMLVAIIAIAAVVFLVIFAVQRLTAPGTGVDNGASELNVNVDDDLIPGNNDTN